MAFSTRVSFALALCLFSCKSAAPPTSAPMSAPEAATVRDGVASAPVTEAPEASAPRVASEPSPEPDPVAPAEQAQEDSMKDDRASAAEKKAPARPAPTTAAPAPKMKLGDMGHGAMGFGSGQGSLGGSSVARAPGLLPLQRVERELSTESYHPIEENRFFQVTEEPLSTFSIDVDTASYANARRFLRDGQLPPKDAIRVEEWINYFPYAYPEPTTDEPFKAHAEVASCPWAPEHRLVKIGIKGKSLSADRVPPRNLTFLLDVSGSMMSPDKLPLLKQGMSLLARSLRPQDKVAIAVYAGASGLVLPLTSGRDQGRILSALSALEAGGSTNGADGIRLAYQVAQKGFVQGGINRVILATDGDFNVGTTSEGELVRLIEQKRQSGVFLTVLGFGTGNLKDSTMEMLADKGNGNYAYIDSLEEARKVLVREAGSTLITIAKDVKLQIEFNPKQVQSYKLIGYENRLLAKEDFNDDKKDAGEIGAGHTVTALYEVVPVGARSPAGPGVDPLKYQAPGAPTPAADSAELLTINLRYKAPQASTSKKLSQVVLDPGKKLESASQDFRFAAAVASFALLLRAPETVKGTSFSDAEKLAKTAVGSDASGERRELIALLERARSLSGR